ncbi:hypothetical protein ACLESD_38720 [Pyxidicoccus sp. 3LFB2]
MRYGLVAGGALLLLVTLLGVTTAPCGSEGRGASGASRAAGPHTGPSASETGPSDGDSAELSGWVQDDQGRPVAARVLAFEAGPEETQQGLERRVASGALEDSPRATTPTGPDGAFSLQVPQGRYHLLAEVEGRPAALALDVQPGPSEVRLVVTAGERLMGQVVGCGGWGGPGRAWC